MKKASRTNARGYWHYAWDYCRAAESVASGPYKSLMFPALHLCGQSIELVLKGFLLGRGETPKAVEKFGHRLDELVSHARRRKLGREANLSPQDLTAIRVLAVAYSRYPYLLRYFVPGVTRVPTVELALQTTQRLIQGLELYCTGVTGRAQRIGS